MGSDLREVFRIFMLPYGIRDYRTLADVEVKGLTQAEGQWAGRPIERISDLGATDHVIVFCSSKTIKDDYAALNCKVSLLMAEPVSVQARYYWLAPFFAKKFHRILTYSDALLAVLKNTVFHVPFVPWVPIVGQADKTELVSLIASAKRLTKGQKLRHAVVSTVRGLGLHMDLYGRGFNEVEDKRTALTPYRFSVCIENSAERNYYTEKILDCFAQKVVPIYWGAPNIGDFFNIEGVIVCRSLSELIAAIKTASVADYERRAAAIQDNYDRVANLPTFEQAAARKLLACA